MISQRRWLISQFDRPAVVASGKLRGELRKGSQFVKD